MKNLEEKVQLKRQKQMQIFLLFVITVNKTVFLILFLPFGHVFLTCYLFCSVPVSTQSALCTVLLMHAPSICG